MNDSVAQLAPEGLIRLLREQRDLYQRLKQLSEQQRRLISGDRPELLLSILRDRQQLVTALARVNEQLAPYRRNWQSICQTLPEVTRHTASALLEEINGMLQVILRTDDEDQSLLSARKQMVARALNEVADGQAANTAYARQSGPAPRGAADLTG